MTTRLHTIGLALLLLLGLSSHTVLAHMTPPVILLSERDAVVSMTAGASKFFVREVRLTPEERETLKQQYRWQPEDDMYRFYLGRDNAGQLVAAVIFLTEFTMHGPVRVAVGLNPDGTLKAAKIVELSEETLPWLQHFLAPEVLRSYNGQGRQGNFTFSTELTRTISQNMAQFYGQIVLSLLHRGTILFDMTVLRRPTKYLDRSFFTLPLA